MLGKSPETSLIVPVTTAFIERRIYLIRGQKVLLDKDLADLYQVRTMRLNEQVKRNAERFPEDFMFRLTPEEIKRLNLSQIAIGSQKHRDPRLTPYAFTELGVAMLSSVLKSDLAVQMNIYIMRAFVELRMALVTHADLARKVEGLAEGQKENTKSLVIISTALNKLRNDHNKLDRKIKKAHRTLKSAIGFQVPTRR
jgi:predicted P-loop ATPase